MTLALTAFAAASARTAVVLFWAAGVVAAAAVMVNQSFVDGAVLAGALRCPAPTRRAEN